MTWTSPPQVDSDFLRISQLPTKRKLSHEEEKMLAVGLTNVLRTPSGTQTLFPVQASALLEISANGGAYVPIRVSAGKTLISLLAGTVLGAQRVLLLVPASLLDKTKRALVALSIHWQIRGFIRIETYSKISTKHGPKVLERYGPDLIVADECHAIANPSAGVSKAIGSWFRTHPDTKYVGLTGTGSKRSILDFALSCKLALRERAPVPLDWYTSQCWAAVLDGVARDDDATEFDPGALARLCNAHEAADGLRGVRHAFRRRYLSTPGIVTTTEPPINIPIVGTIHRVNPCADVAAAMAKIRDTWCTPDGQEFQEASVMWQHIRQMAKGLCYYWDPPPPPQWRERRKRHFREVREILGSNGRGLHVPSAVVDAIKEGFYPTAEEGLREWEEIEPTFRPRTVAMWISDRTTEWAKDYLASNRPTLVFVEHNHFADRLARETGIPLYQGKARDSHGRPIMDHAKNYGNSHALASIVSCSTGQDLEFFDRILFLGLPLTGRQCEQAIGRVHRVRQTAREIEVDFLIGCPEDERALTACREDSLIARDVRGEHWKLLGVDWTNE